MYKRTTEEQEWHSRLIHFSAEHINPGALRREEKAIFDRNLWEACAALGLTGLTVPKEYGGLGFNALSTVKILESLGYTSEDTGLNFGIAAHLLAVAVPIAKFGTEKQKSTYLPSFCNGNYIGGNAITERSAGSDVFTMSTIAQVKDNGYLLNGTKTYCSNGKNADIILTYAITHPEKGFFGGISAFLAENGVTDFNWSEGKAKLGLRSCAVSEVIFRDTFFDGNSRLGQEGAGAQIFNLSMDWERACLGAIHLGAMDRLLEMAVEFANGRFSGGKNLSSRQAVTHPLAELKMRLEGARLLTYRAADAIDEGVRRHPFCSLAKMAVSECYRDLTVQLMQLFASTAYETPNPIETQLRAALGATLYSGTSEIHRNLVATDLGLRAKNSLSTKEQN